LAHEARCGPVKSSDRVVFVGIITKIKNIVISIRRFFRL
jgi:hypothetical protein